jgi:hypothetical protein
MCHIYITTCRFCNREAEPLLRDCDNRGNNSCLQRSQWKKKTWHKKGTRAPNELAIMVLPRALIRTTCTSCWILLNHILSLLPMSCGSTSLNGNVAYVYKGTYMCKLLMDATYTAATHGLERVAMYLTEGIAFDELQVTEEDVSLTHVRHIPEKDWQNLYKNSLLKDIDGLPAGQIEPILKAGGENARAELQRNMATRIELQRLIELRDELESRYQKYPASAGLNKYRVLIDTRNAPIEHIKLAIRTARHGTSPADKITLDDIAERAARWDSCGTGDVGSEALPEVKPKWKWVDKLVGLYYDDSLGRDLDDVELMERYDEVLELEARTDEIDSEDGGVCLNIEYSDDGEE